jgi:hypothetical protein
MLEGNIPTLEAPQSTISNPNPLLFLAGSVRSRLKLSLSLQPTDPADLIHLLQKLHILLLEAGMIGAHVLFCESLHQGQPFKKKENPPFQKKKKAHNYCDVIKDLFLFNQEVHLGQENRIFPSGTCSGTNTPVLRFLI